MINYLEYKNIELDVMYGRHEKKKEVKRKKNGSWKRTWE